MRCKVLSKFNKCVNVAFAILLTEAIILSAICIALYSVRVHRCLEPEEPQVSESSFSLGDDIYVVDDMELYISRDEIFSIESRFIWYTFNKFGKCRVYDSSELTNEILEKRGGKGEVIIERCIGYVVDGDSGDGVVVNTGYRGDYITYRNTSVSYKTGTVFLTFFVYADNNYIDDCERFDFVLTREYEV